MLTLQVMNSDATINTFLFQSSFNFYSGEDFTVKLRLYDNAKKLRYIPDTGATFSIDLQNSDGTTLTKTLTNPFADDRSVVEFSITAAESANLISQNLLVSIDESGNTTLASLSNGFIKTVSNGSC